jgi:hypothetical protein
LTRDHASLRVVAEHRDVRLALIDRLVQAFAQR